MCILFSIDGLTSFKVDSSEQFLKSYFGCLKRQRFIEQMETYINHTGSQFRATYCIVMCDTKYIFRLSVAIQCWKPWILYKMDLIDIYFSCFDAIVFNLIANKNLQVALNDHNYNLRCELVQMTYAVMKFGYYVMSYITFEKYMFPRSQWVNVPMVTQLTVHCVDNIPCLQQWQHHSGVIW